ncbi:MAG: hypothetical protein A2428_12800 [Bdellovibrionales bacterium RIFOXYC1_FULL_54_43]|nr:MAG: hypothetical protein A2428_12800 [Bdellovibrionales bacterium RIFOXYC1_FULL_54_43]OFZ81561.1 MAG: hypothetical protein A2603_11575 [Bdellovibrionales bacterium RIFOXYD1_FULL_55_31]
MCGIVGYVGKRPAVEILLAGLKRLEYRGYDSAGVAFFREEKIEIHKSEGKLENVEKLLNGRAPAYQDVCCGIGHTRWATHGKPTTQNAHPHRTGHVVLVHNGIIENYQEIKREIISKGYRPESETDSELFGFLVLEQMDRGASLMEAVRQSFARLQGACSVVIMSEREPNVVIGVRNGSPLVAAADPAGGTILASDAQPLLQFTRDVVFLEHGDIVLGTEKGLRFFELETGKPVARASSRLDWSVEKLDKQGFPHYMLKEIYEQPTALMDTLNGFLDRARTDSFPLAASQPGVALLEKAREITLVACGSSWHAASLGKYWLEKWARVPVTVELASEYRYRDPVLGANALLIGISQSGETADTLAVIREARKQGIPTIGITNVRGSTLSREADATFFTFAGPEIGVAATKTFLAQMLGLLIFSGFLSLKRDGWHAGSLVSLDSVSRLFEDMIRIPHLLSDFLGNGSSATGLAGVIRKIAAELASAKGFFFIGRGYSFPVALEGALKLKEIAYVHAEGYAAGELKHGPIAMIDREMVVVVLAPRDQWRDKTVSNLQEVKARGAIILGIGNASDEELIGLCDHWIELPSVKVDESLVPFFLTPVIQLLSYELALLHGTDVDKPRNLAKSVTVE